MRPIDSAGGVPVPSRGRAAALVFGGTLVALVAGAAFLRLWQIQTQPGGLNPDEAAEAWDAWKILHVSGFHPLFFDDDGGRESLFAYIVAGVFRVAGPSVATLRGTSAVLGILGVAVTPLALRRFGRPVQLAGTAWAAGALWLICIDRDGFRNVLVPLVATLALAALLTWLDRPSRTTALLAGAVCGLGLWTYQPLKLIPLWVGLWLLIVRVRDPERWARLRPHLLAGLIAYAVVAAPIAYVALTDPTGYFNRSVVTSAANPTFGYGELPIHWLRTVLMFGITGDPNERHNVAGAALLPPLVALIAILGVVRCWRNRREPGHLLVLVGLPVFLIPGLFAVEGDAPHFLRALGLEPIMAALVGLGAVEAVRVGRRLLGERRGAVAGTAVAVMALAAMTVQSATLYFNRATLDRYGPYSFDLVALAAAARQPGTVVLLDHYAAPVVQFLDRDQSPTVIDEPLAGRVHLAPGTTVVARFASDLDAALGAGAQRAAQVVAHDPDGNPVVFRIVVGS
ncbi:MAG TPA: hypothetical protein VI316_10055 [Candidatus Dormibacteraeota bacterium]